jgi:hypothetical protein
MAKLIRFAGDSLGWKAIDHLLTTAWNQLLRDRHGIEPCIAVLTAIYENPRIRRRLDCADSSKLPQLITKLATSFSPKERADLARLCLVLGEFVDFDVEQKIRSDIVAGSDGAGSALGAVFATRNPLAKDFLEAVMTFVKGAIQEGRDVSGALGRMVGYAFEYLEVDPDGLRKEFIERLLEMNAVKAVDLSPSFRSIKGEFTFEEVKAIVSTAFRKQPLNAGEWEFASELFSGFPEKRRELLELFPVKRNPMDPVTYDLTPIFGAPWSDDED